MQADQTIVGVVVNPFSLRYDFERVVEIKHG